MIQSILVILNLFMLETLLSVDNAAVLAILVKNLPPKDQKKALRYGIIGAFAFRGLCLLIASWLIKLSYLKILGGIYLVWLTFRSGDSNKDVGPTDKSKLIKTIITVE